MAGHDVVSLVLLVVMCSLLSGSSPVDSRFSGSFSDPAVELPREEEFASHGVQTHSRRLTGLVAETPLIVPYHSGPILSGEGSIPVYIIWYGTFSAGQRSPIVDFFCSFGVESEALPTVRSWWGTTKSYKDAHGVPVMSNVHLAGQMSDDYSKGKSLSEADLKDLMKQSLTAYPADSKAVYFVLTADDVLVESFCMNACGSHYFTVPSSETKWQQLPYAWVGNAVSQCAGRCAWPYAKPMYGPQTEPLLAPNGDVGVEGMIINLATLLVGIATNPFNNAFYQGDASAPLEAATACSGKFGEGAYPGYPGSLLVDKITGASYNAVGLDGRKFLLPALWDPSTLSCKSTFSPQTGMGSQSQ